MVAVVEGGQIHLMMQCPRCSTRWRVAAASPVENPLFKCGRCHHLFRQFPGAPTPTESSPLPHRRSARAPAELDTLEFIFPERQPAEIPLAEDAPPASPSPDTDVSTVVVTAAPRAAAQAVDAAPAAVTTSRPDPAGATSRAWKRPS